MTVKATLCSFFQVLSQCHRLAYRMFLSEDRPSGQSECSKGKEGRTEQSQLILNLNLNCMSQLLKTAASPQTGSIQNVMFVWICCVQP